MDTLNRDLRHAIHSLRRAPGFSTAVLLILALGIGMSTAMFTVFKTALVDRLPVREQDRVVVMNTLDQGGRTLDVPYPYLSEIARDSALFRGVAGVYHLGAWPEPSWTASRRSCSWSRLRRRTTSTFSERAPSSVDSSARRMVSPVRRRSWC